MVGRICIHEYMILSDLFAELIVSLRPSSEVGTTSMSSLAETDFFKHSIDITFSLAGYMCSLALGVR